MTGHFREKTSLASIVPASGTPAARNAVAAAVNAGKRSIEAVAVVSRADEPTPPCGGCRQVLNEFGPDMTVTVESAMGERAVWRLTEILPHAFGPSNLGK